MTFVFFRQIWCSYWTHCSCFKCTDLILRLLFLCAAGLSPEKEAGGPSWLCASQWWQTWWLNGTCVCGTLMFVTIPLSPLFLLCGGEKSTKSSRQEFTKWFSRPQSAFLCCLFVSWTTEYSSLTLYPSSHTALLLEFKLKNSFFVKQKSQHTF